MTDGTGQIWPIIGRGTRKEPPEVRDLNEGSVSDTDGCAKDEHGNGFVEAVDGTSPQAKKLFRACSLAGLVQR